MFVTWSEQFLTHWGRVTHICVTKLTIIGSDNGLPPGRRQAIIWTNAGILLIGALGTNVSEILIKIYTFSLKKMHLKMLSGKRRPSCLGLNVLRELCCTLCTCPAQPSVWFVFYHFISKLCGHQGIQILTHCGLVTPYGDNQYWLLLSEVLVVFTW